jgi:hypothetical protein
LTAWLRISNGYSNYVRHLLIHILETPFYSTIKVTEADIFDRVDDKKPRKIRLCSEWKGMQQSRDIILSYRSGYLIVQTDKPIYTPQQTGMRHLPFVIVDYSF